MFQKGYIYPYQPPSETRPFAVAGSGVTKDRGKDSETSRNKRLLFLETLFLVFARTLSLGSETSFYDRAFGLLVSPTFLEPPRVARVWSRVDSSL